MNLKRIIAGPLLSLLFLLFSLYALAGIKWFFNNSIQNPAKTALLADVSGVSRPRALPEINAESAISLESNLSTMRKTVFQKDADKVLPIASLTKLMTAIIVLDNYNLSDTVAIDKSADSQAPMKQDVKIGDTMPVESFLEIMLASSSNKSAYALADLMGEQKFVGLMNQKAREIGLKNTFFDDPTGLSPKNVSTVNDLAKLAEYILRDYNKIADISSLREIDVPGFGRVINTDQLLGEIPQIVCGKTGFTKEANGCLLLVINNTKNNDYFINVVLGAEDRFVEMEKLITMPDTTCN